MLTNACPKPKPRALEKVEKAKRAERQRKDIKAQVWARDGGKCRVCGDAAQEMHELRFRSLGGRRSTLNSIAVCAFGTRHNCHSWLQKHAIEVEGTNADQRLIFRWNRALVPVEQEPFQIRSKRRSFQPSED